jgi:N-acetylglucosaminyldiphosphoundecaprenol N-acetyl-beta-D-mannosaminyltransferase
MSRQPVALAGIMVQETNYQAGLVRRQPELGVDLSRQAYCVLGVPVDVVEMSTVLQVIETAAATKVRLSLSTPNVNWLITAQRDQNFRESVLQSDLCAADGMPIVWISRLLGIPLKNRIAGADIFDALKGRNLARPLKVFLFGGAEGVAATACRNLNEQSGGLRCVGSLDPGYGSVDELSRGEIIREINSSGADFLVVSLGAMKGQMWLQRNHRQLQIPVQAHLGAVVSFQAGTIQRSPYFLSKLGLEWLWRIKEEPFLWKRYWSDGGALLRILFTRVLPLAFWTAWLQFRCALRRELVITEAHESDYVFLMLVGPATARNVHKALPALDNAIATQKRVVIDFSHTSGVDARFLGLLLMLRKTLKSRGCDLACIGLSRAMRTVFCLNGLEFILSN